MPQPYRKPNPCENWNHRRPNPPVAFCPQCGQVVNQAASPAQCSEAKHATARRQQQAYCVDCGAKIIETFLK
jgi:hypothetical protein